MKQWAKALGIFSIIIGEIVGLTVAGVFLGKYLKDHHGLPEITVLFTGILGFIFSLILLIRFTKQE